MSPVLEGQMMARLTRETYQREHPVRAWMRDHTDELVVAGVGLEMVLTYVVIIVALAWWRARR